MRELALMFDRVAGQALVVVAMLLLALAQAAGQVAPDPERIARIQAHREALASEGPLAIQAVRVEQESVAQYGRVELSVDLSATYDNPYDPAQILVQANFRSAGTDTTIPGFFYIPFEPLTPGTILSGNAPYKRAGESCWKIRFTPRTPGSYTCRVTARDASGKTVQSDDLTVRVAPVQGKGFVRAAKGNPRYFEYDDGSLFYPSGANVAWTHEYFRGKTYATYEYYFDKLAQAGSNATRVWLCHWSWPEWTPNETGGDGTFSGYAAAGYYNQKVACGIDRVFELAEKHGLQICLCLDDNDEQFDTPDYGNWEWNSYNAKNGGPCQSPSEFWSSPEARRLYKQRLTYINARWGYSPSFWCWNMWNDCSEAGPAVQDWLREMYGHIRSIQTNCPDRPVGTNFGHAGASFYNDIMDYINGGGGPVYFERVSQFGDYWTRKPFSAMECHFNPDPELFLPSVHDSFWRLLGNGLAGAMCWSWELFEQCGWEGFRQVLDFVAPLPLNREATRPIQASVGDVQLDRPGAPFTIPVALRPVYRWGQKADTDTFDVGLKGCPQEAQLGGALYGLNESRRPWRTVPAFNVDSPDGGTLVIDVNEIGGGDQVLLVSLDGSTVVRKTLAGGRRSLSDAAERYTEISLPPGKHTLAVSNEGPDWLSVSGYTFMFSVQDPNAFPPVELLGQQGSDFAFFWLHNIYNSEVTSHLGIEPRQIRQARITVRDLEPGTYTAEWWDTHAGECISRRTIYTDGESIAVQLPAALDADVACRVLPAAGD